MKTVKKIAALAAVLLILAGCGQPAPPTPEPSATASIHPQNDTLKVTQYNTEAYARGEKSAEAYKFEGSISAGIIPHHGVASKLMASFFATLTDEYDTVVIIGPNHYSSLGGVVYSDCDWQTEKGTVEADADLATLLGESQKLKAIRGNTQVQSDHSVTWHIPYVADCLPTAKVQPVMVSAMASKTQLSALVETLSEYGREHSLLVIGSIDFSHYLMPDEAMENNETTKKIIAAEDYGKLLTLDSDYIDSPETLYVVMKYCEGIEKELELLDESISNEESSVSNNQIDPGDGTTTYLVYGA